MHPDPVSHLAPAAAAAASAAATSSEPLLAVPPWLHAFLLDVLFNSLGSMALMALIVVVIDSIQAHMRARPATYVRFPCLPATEPPSHHRFFATNMGTAVLFGLAMALFGITTSNPVPASFALLAGRLAATLVVYDLGLYLVHAMQHTLPLAIKFHRVHHAVHLHASDVTHGDLADFLEAFVPILLVPAVLKFNIAEMWCLTFALQIHGAVTHAGCSIPALDALDFFVVGPRFHAVHHTMHRFNYGTLFTVWDQVLGTAVPIGVADARLWRKRKSVEAEAARESAAAVDAAMPK
ncbi:hypothetical protein HK105_208010 [Polyrhizophydium stewartii]|uniref:Fatty acid hydroxylase domain-containing protein n=1 Tax=Polyrhizophydium stewartii TaxID=2732419 RepID=A0ABR4MZ27_9FUNG|nr:hypothetical protein HK105_004079 [Polyrhizophydium stewartii]